GRGRPRLDHAGGERDLLRRRAPPREPARADLVDPHRRPDPRPARHPVPAPEGALHAGGRPDRRARGLPLLVHRGPRRGGAPQPTAGRHEVRRGGALRPGCAPMAELTAWTRRCPGAGPGWTGGRRTWPRCSTGWRPATTVRTRSSRSAATGPGGAPPG